MPTLGRMSTPRTCMIAYIQITIRIIHMIMIVLVFVVLIVRILLDLIVIPVLVCVLDSFLVV